MGASMAASAKSEAVILEDVSFSYPKRAAILNISRLEIAAGESVFLHGPSGSGKSTLLSLVAGVLQPSSGRLQVLGHEFGSVSPSLRDRVRGTDMGYVFQSFNLIPYLSVQQNIALPCQLYRARRQRVRASTLALEIERLARRLDILDILPVRVGEISVGQQQRVAIARALIGTPALLIADEPTSSLDTQRRDEFVALLLELLEEARLAGTPTTLLYVSHDLGLSSRFEREVSLPLLNRAGGKQAHAAA